MSERRISSKLKSIFLCQAVSVVNVGGVCVAAVGIINCIRKKRLSCQKERTWEEMLYETERERQREEEFNTNTKLYKRRKEMKRCIIGWTQTDWLGCSKGVSCTHTSRNPLSHLSYMLSYYFFSIYYWEIKMEPGFLCDRIFYIGLIYLELHSFLLLQFFLRFISYLCSVIL